jgi:hypothetical protein
MSGTVSVEAMASVAHHVRTEYGEYGYSIGLIYGSYGGGGIFSVLSADGSQFELVASRHGVIHRACDRDDCRDEGKWRPYVGSGDYICDRHSR